MLKVKGDSMINMGNLRRRSDNSKKSRIIQLLMEK